VNELKHIDDFRGVLKDYRPSNAAREALKQITLVLMVGPTASGRNTIINELVDSEQYRFIVSDTTRKPRVNNGVPEQNGREYWFRSEDEFLEDLKAGAFLEAAIIHEQQVSGISVRELRAVADEGKIAINEIEEVGAANIFAAKPDAIFFFIVPPSFDEWMVRMKGRGELPADETRRRLTSVLKEISTALENDYFYFVVNDTYKHAAKHIDEVVRSGVRDEAAEKQARESAKELLEETKRYLAENA
jgi:guanylate kinase